MISEEGSTVIQFRSIDNDGNQEGIKYGWFNIDRSPPETFLDIQGVLWFDGGYIKDITISFWAEDYISDVAQIEYSFDTIDWSPFNDLFDISAAGVYDLYYRSTDIAGNQEDYKMETITIHSIEDLSNYFTYGTNGNLEDLDPQNAWGSTSIDIINQVVETLFAYDLNYLDTTIVPQLASDFGTWSPDRLNYTLPLLEGIQFHDETDFNAHAVKWNFDRLFYFMDTWQTQFESLYRWKDGTDIIDRVEVVNTYTVRFILNRPFAALEPLLTFSGSGIMSPTSTPEFNHIDKYSDILVGTGPFVYDEFVENVGVRYHAYENYRDGVADIENLAILFIWDNDFRHEALLSGHIDYTDNLNTEMLDSFINNPDFQVESTQSAIIRYITMNNQVISKTFRQAISYAYDYSYVIDELYGGYGQKLQSPIPDGILYANWGYNYPLTNITRAREILIEAGICNFDIDVDQEWLDAASINPLATFNYGLPQNNILRENIGLELQNNLALIGIRIEFLYAPSFWELYTNAQDYDMFYIGWGADYNDPSNFINPLYSSGTPSNLAFVDDPYLENLMDQGLLEIDPLAREAIYDTIQQYIIEDLMPLLYIHQSINHDIYSMKYVGLQTNVFNRKLFYYVHLRTVVIETQVGEDVSIVSDDHDMDLTFDTVTEGGTVTITQLDEGPLPDTGLEFAGELYEITTDIVYEGTINISLSYTEHLIIGEEADLKLMHWNGVEWEDITTYVDTTENIIYGETLSFSVFAVIDQIDTIAPLTTIIPTGTLGENGWYILDVEIDFNISDDYSSEEEITSYYSYNKNDWYEYPRSLIISQEGTTTIFYRSEDAAGNLEDIQSSVIKIDKNAPATQLYIGDHYVDANGDIYVPFDTEFEFSAIEETSGLEYIKYSINGGSWIDYTTPFLLDDSIDVYTIEYYSVDSAGNEEDISAITINLVFIETQSYLSCGESNPITFFDVIFSKDKQSGGYRLVATNPGQIFYHIDFINNWPTPIDSLTIEAVIPSDFLLKGDNPIIVNVPAGSELVIIIHLDYALKGTIYPTVEDFGMIGYEFSTIISANSGDPSIIDDGLVQSAQSSANFITHQKKTTAIAGFVTDSNGNPIIGAIIELCDGNGNVLISTETNELGFYYFIDIEEGDYQIHLTYPTNSDDPYIEIKYATAYVKELTEIDFIIPDE